MLVSLPILQMLKNEKYRFSFTLKDTKIGEDMYNRQPSFVKVTDYYNPGKYVFCQGVDIGLFKWSMFSYFEIRCFALLCCYM